MRGDAAMRGNAAMPVIAGNGGAVRIGMHCDTPIVVGARIAIHCLQR